MNCRLRHKGFDSPLRALLDYLILISDMWEHMLGVYTPGVGLKGPVLVRMHVIKKRIIVYGDDIENHVDYAGKMSNSIIIKIQKQREQSC